MQHHKLQAAQHVALAALGHVAHLVGDQAAYGVELIRVFARLQVHAKGGGNARNGCGAIDAVAAVGQGKNVALVVFNIELVFNFSDDLLQHVFDGD